MSVYLTIDCCLPQAEHSVTLIINLFSTPSVSPSGVCGQDCDLNFGLIKILSLIIFRHNFRRITSLNSAE